jgi:hypothetical protein
MCPSVATRHVYPCTRKIQLSLLVWQKADIINISLKINLFSPWYSWKSAELALNSNHPLTKLDTFCIYFFSPPGHVSFCHHLASVVHRKLSHLNLLLWNPWTKLTQTWQGWSLGGSLSKLCPTDPPSIQDGCCY